MTCLYVCTFLLFTWCFPDASSASATFLLTAQSFDTSSASATFQHTAQTFDTSSASATVQHTAQTHVL